MIDIWRIKTWVFDSTILKGRSVELRGVASGSAILSAVLTIYLQAIGKLILFIGKQLKRIK